MERNTKCFVIGLLCFTLGSMFLAGYFLTPDYKSIKNQDVNIEININYSFSDKQYALPFGISLMVFGFLVVLCGLCATDAGRAE